MKHYRLFRYENNAVGGSFAFCSEEELAEVKKGFNPDTTTEIPKTEYTKEIERNNRRSLRLVTGYPK